MGKIKIYFLGAVFLLFLPGLVLSQTVLLKTGQKVEGKIVEQTDKYVKMEFQGVGLIFYTDEIASIEQAPSAVDTGAAAAQMEKFYQGFLAARNAPAELPEAPKEPAKAAAQEAEQKPAQEEKTPADQPASAAEEAARAKEEAYLARVPMEYRDQLKEDLAKMKLKTPPGFEDKK